MNARDDAKRAEAAIEEAKRRSPVATTNGRLTIKPKAYRRVQGFLVFGRLPRWIYPVRVFCMTYDGAVKVKAALKAGDSAEVTRLLLAGA